MEVCWKRLVVLLSHLELGIVDCPILFVPRN